MNKIIFFICLISVNCTSYKNIQSNANNSHVDIDSSLYRVYKIDSNNTYYLIYVKRKDSLFKIVSQKNENIKNSTLIKIGGQYDLKLNSIWTKGILIGGVNVSPSVTPNVTCLSFDDSTRICIERDSINDLHKAENLRGLYFISER